MVSFISRIAPYRPSHTVPLFRHSLCLLYLQAIIYNEIDKNILSIDYESTKDHHCALLCAHAQMSEQ